MQNLERLIHQTQPFKSSTAKAEVGLIYITNRINAKLSELFKPFDVTTQQYNVLRILRGQYPNAANINMIKERMLDRMSDASRIVDRLVKMGLATKQTNILDKRNTDVIITEEGLELLVKIDAIFYAETSFLSNLEEVEINTLNRIFDKILSVL